MNQRLLCRPLGEKTGKREAGRAPQDDPFRNPGVARTLGSATGAGAIVDSRASVEKEGQAGKVHRAIYVYHLICLAGWLAGWHLPPSPSTANDPFRTRESKPKPEAIAVTWRDFVLLPRLLLRLVQNSRSVLCVDRVDRVDRAS